MISSMPIPATVTSKKELQDYADSHKLSRNDLQEIYNSLPGAPLMKRLRNRPTAIDHIWEQIKTQVHEHRTGTKRQRLIQMLKVGCTVDGIMEKLGWQRHTIRGIISTLQSNGVIKVTVSKEGARIVGYKGA